MHPKSEKVMKKKEFLLEFCKAKLQIYYVYYST